MKNLFSLLTISIMFMLMGGQCKKGSDQNTQYLFTSWKHSYEEDEEGINVFRDINYSFPPSRGRRGFTITANGTFIDQPIAPTDGNEQNKGSWQHKGNVLTVVLENGRTYKVEIISLEKGLMKVRKK